MFLEMFGKKLEDSGFHVDCAKNGSWGVNQALNGDYDLIITDMMMPVMTGEEIIVKLRENEKTKNIPIIVISASVTNEVLHGLKQYGVNDCFLKTKIVPSDLSRRVEEILR